MKKTLKITLAILTVMLVVISMTAIAVCANTGDPAAEPELSIKACTLAFDDSVYIMYAVPEEAAAGADVKILYFTDPMATIEEYNKDNAVYCESSFGRDTVEGVECITFKNKHLNAKNMTDVIYSRAYAKVGDKEYYSPLVKYSILEYAYNMLGYTTNNEPTPKLEKMLKNMLSYGASAQEYFDYNLENLATDEYFKISVVGGVMADACTKGMYKENEQLTLTATQGDENTIVKWYDSQGILKGEGETLPITVGTKNETYTAVREVILHDTYTVTFVDYDGSEIEKVENVSYGASVTAPEVPERDGYKFVGWDVDFSNVTSDLTVTAQYEENVMTETYTVTFYDYDGVTVLATEIVEKGESATLPDDPEKDGASFIGWSGNYVNVEKNENVTAVYSDQTNVFVLSAGNGAVGDTITVTLSLKGSVSLCSFNLVLNYGNSLKLVTYDNELSIYMPTTNPEKDEDGNIIGDNGTKVNMTWAATSNKTKRTDVIELTFEIVDENVDKIPLAVVVNGVSRINGSQQIDADYSTVDAVIEVN